MGYLTSPPISETTFAHDKYQKKPSRLIMKCLYSVCFLSVYITLLSLPCKGPFAALIFVLLCSLKHFSILQKRNEKTWETAMLLKQMIVI